MAPEKFCSLDSAVTASKARRTTGGRLVRGATLLIASEIVIRILTLATMLFVARILGPEALGQLAIAQAVVAFAGVLGEGGLTTLTQRSMVREPPRAERLVASTTSIQLAFSTLLVLGVLGAARVLPIDRTAQHLVVVLSPLIVAPALNLFYVLQAREQIGRLAVVRVLGQMVASGLTVILVLVTNSNTWVAVAIWTSALFTNLLCFVFLRAGGFRLRRPAWETGIELLKGGWPYFAISILGCVLQNFDVLVVGATRSSQEAGEYAAAYRIILLAIGLSGLISAVAFPELVRRYRDDLPGFARFLQTLIRQSTRVGYAMAVLVAFVAPEIVLALYGNDYQQSGPLLALLVVAVPLSFCNNLLGQGMLAAGRERRYLGNIAATAAISIVALLLFVPKNGAAAAAWIVLGAELVTLVLFTVQTARSLDVIPAVELATQLPWLLFPAISLAVVTILWPQVPVSAVVVVWLTSVVIVELAGGRRLYRETVGLGRGRQ